MRIYMIEHGICTEYIVQVVYGNTPKQVRIERDKYGRDVYTVWSERRTTVRVYEWKDNVDSRTEWHGTTVCKYSDECRKKVGRMIAWKHVLKEMYDRGCISAKMYDLASTFDLACTIAVIDVDKNEIRVKA